MNPYLMHSPFGQSQPGYAPGGMPPPLGIRQPMHQPQSYPVLQGGGGSWPDPSQMREPTQPSSPLGIHSNMAQQPQLGAVGKNAPWNPPTTQPYQPMPQPYPDYTKPQANPFNGSLASYLPGGSGAGSSSPGPGGLPGGGPSSNGPGSALGGGGPVNFGGYGPAPGPYPNAPGTYPNPFTKPAAMPGQQAPGQPGMSYGNSAGAPMGNVQGLGVKAHDMGVMSNYGQLDPSGKNIWMNAGGGGQGAWTPYNANDPTQAGINGMFNRYGSNWYSGSPNAFGHSSDMQGQWQALHPGQQGTQQDYQDLYMGVNPGEQQAAHNAFAAQSAAYDPNSASYNPQAVQGLTSLNLNARR